MDKVCCIDAMHAVVLGIMQMMNGNPWGLKYDFQSKEVKHRQNMTHMAKLWKSFYKSYHHDSHHRRWRLEVGETGIREQTEAIPQSRPDVELPQVPSLPDSDLDW